MGAEVREGAAPAEPVIMKPGEPAALPVEAAVATSSRAAVAAVEETTSEPASATVIDLRSGDPVVRLEPAAPIRSRATSGYVRFVKPALDGAFAVVALMPALPILLVVAAGIRATMGRYVLFRQPRVGKDGVVFDVLKFRTMSEDRRYEEAAYVGPERRMNHKSEDDPRHTAFGRFLRKWSLDELPQLFNVLRGEMSIVGPRPEMVSVVERYRPWQHDRHQVRPGITCIWQISERGDVPLHEATHLDIEYVETVSLLTDLRIIARTPAAAMGRSKGV